MQSQPIAALVLLLSALTVQAQSELSYNSLEMSWSMHGAAGGAFTNGFALGGTAGVSDHVFLTGAVHAVESDQQSRIVTTATTVGMGLHVELVPGVDLVSAAAAHLHVRYRDDNVVTSVRQDGASASIGLRARFGSRLEASAGVRYARFDHRLEDTIWSGGTRFYFSPTFAAGFDVSDSDDGTVWGMVLRYDIFNPYGE